MNLLIKYILKIINPFVLQQSECVPVNDLCADNDLRTLIISTKNTWMI